jgi:type IV secretory pathway VirB2 component (pilin)
MRGILYDRIKRGVLLTSVGAAFLIPVASAQACPAPQAPAWGFWSHILQVVHGAPAQHAGGSPSGGNITGHRIG